jgi:hypothetical protein
LVIEEHPELFGRMSMAESPASTFSHGELVFIQEDGVKWIVPMDREHLASMIDHFPD